MNSKNKFCSYRDVVLIIIYLLSINIFASAQKTVTAEPAERTVILPTNNSKASKILLPNGWSLSPAGRSLPLGDLPLNMSLSHNKQLLAVTNNGHGKQVIQLIDPK